MEEFLKYKKSPWGNIPYHWVISSIKDETEVVTDYVANGSFASLAENVKYKSEKDYAVLIRLVDYNNQFKGDFVYIDKDAYEFLGKSKLYGDEIIISNVGANVGTVFKCPHLEFKMSLAPNSIMVKFKGNNDFYYYWLKSRFGQHMLQSIVTGSAQPKFNKTNFRDLHIPVPPLCEQENIASILKSLDDKIEVNKRINDNLEQQAQALFKSWFVDFEPFKDGEFMESELGMIPKGWRMGKLGELCQFKRGKGLLSKNAIPGDVPVVAGGLEPACYHNVSNTKAPVITVSGSGANAGFMRMYYQEVWASDCSFIDITCENWLFVYCFLAINSHLLRHAQTGAVQPHVKPADIHEFDLAIPPKEVIQSFQNSIQPFISKKGLIEQESQKLAAIRDTLLPRLMSGEIKIT